MDISFHSYSALAGACDYSIRKARGKGKYRSIPKGRAGAGIGQIKRAAGGVRGGETVWISKRKFRMLEKSLSDLEMAVQDQKDFNNNMVNAFKILGVNTHILFPESFEKADKKYGLQTSCVP